MRSSTGAASSFATRVPAVVSWAVCAVLTWIVVGVVVAPVQHQKLYAGWEPLVAAAMGLAVLPLVVALVRRVVRVLEPRPVLRRTLAAFVLAGLAVWLLVLGRAVRFFPGWDAGQVERSAFALAHHGSGSVDLGWLEVYPNNLFLLGVMTRWFELCDLLGVENAAHAVVLLNIVTLLLTLVITVAAARRWGGAVLAGVVGVLAVLFVATSPWIGVAYSDTIGMLFPVTLFWFFLLARDARTWWQRSLCWVGIGLIWQWGVEIKPTVIFAFLAVAALALWSLLTSLREDEERTARAGRLVRSVVVGLAATALGAGLAQASVAALARPLGIVPAANGVEQAAPATHFMKMGAARGALSNREHPLGKYTWGGYNHYDVVDMREVAPEDRLRHGWEGYVERVRDFGPAGYALFLHEKANWTFGDGTFHAYGEGTMALPGQDRDFTDPLSELMRTVWVPEGEHYPLTSIGWQAIWLVVLVLVAVPVAWRRRGLLDLESTVLRVALAGLLVFLLFFETRPRYLYLYLPFFLLLAGQVLAALPERWPWRRRQPGENPTDAV